MNYEGYDIDNTWKFSLGKDGIANFLNPNDPTQNFNISYKNNEKFNELNQFVSSGGQGSAQVGYQTATDNVPIPGQEPVVQPIETQSKPLSGSVQKAESLGAPKGMSSKQAQDWMKQNNSTGNSYKQPSTKTFDNITPTSTPAYSLTGANLNVGSQGSDVSQLQEFINFATGSNLTVDGQYGPKTQAAVKQLQSQLGITADGIVGPQTTKALNDYMAKILKANPDIKAPTSINSGNLQAGGSTNLPSKGSNTSSGADSLIGGITANMSAEEAKVAKQYNELEGEISKLLGNSVGQGQAQINAEAVAGVPQLEKELSNLNAQIKVGLAEYQIEKDKYDTLSLENRNKPVTMNSIIGSEAAINFARQQTLNRKASDIGLLQAQASGVAGNLELAQSTANKAVELKYADIKTLLETKLSQLELLGDRLTREEKKTADFLERQYTKEKDAIDAQEADEKSLNTFTLNAMQDYRSAGIKLGDSYETIQNKIVGSSEYRAEQTKATTKTATEAERKDDVASVVVDFQNQMKQKGWSGANPDAYDYYRNELIKLYGSSAALDLDKAMLDAGISVDYENI